MVIKRRNPLRRAQRAFKRGKFNRGQKLLRRSVGLPGRGGPRRARAPKPVGVPVPKFRKAPGPKAF